MLLAYVHCWRQQQSTLKFIADCCVLPRVALTNLDSSAPVLQHQAAHEPPDMRLRIARANFLVLKAISLH